MANETASLLLAVDSRQVKDGARSLDDLAKSGAGAEQATKGLTSASDLLAGTVRAVVGAYSSLKLGQFISEATSLNQRYSQMGLVMSVVAANTGKSRSEFDTTANTLQKLGISMLESRNTVIKLATANVDLANAEKLADLARNAAIVGNINTSQALDRLVLGVQSAQVEVLRGIGINVSFERSYNTLAKQMGVSVQQLTETQKQQARLNAVLAEATNFTGLYEASLANAGKMMKSTERLSENLKIKIGAIFDDAAMLAVSAYSNQLLDLNNEADRLAANNSIKDWSRGIAIELAFVMDMGRNVFGIFGALGGLIAEQGQNLANLDFDKMTGTFAKADAQLKAVLSDTSKYQDMVNSRIIQEDLLTDKITGQNNNVRENTKNTGENTKTLNENTEAVKKAAKVKDELTIAELKMQESTKNTIDLDRQVKSLIASVATEQDKYNETLKELDRLKPYVPVEIYNRALKKAQEELKGTSKVAKEMTTETNEYSKAWGQTWSSIEQTGKQAFIQFAAHGTGAMKSIGEAIKLSVLDMLYQLTVRKWIINIGSSLESSFLGAAASSAGSAVSGAGLLSKVGSGAGIMSLLKGGASGITSGISGMMSGGGLGALALPLLGGFALNSASNAFAGDKTLGNGFTDFMQKIPILGAGWDILAGFFGREPYKFRQQSIQGTASAGGFDGDISNVFRSQGGVFSGNRHRTKTEEFSKEQQAIFDGAIGGFYTSAKGFVDNLGMSADLVDNFSKQVQIKSEKGKTVTEEAIAEMIAGIGDSLAKNVLPNVEDFRNVGETTIQTLSRLSSEFSVLTDAAALLFDKSSGWAQDFVKQFGFSQRSDFLTQAGGADAFAANVAGFAQNFLSDDQRMRPIIEGIVAERDRLGLSGINTRDQFTSAVTSGKLSAEQTLFLISNQATAKIIFDYLDSKNGDLNKNLVYQSTINKEYSDSVNRVNSAISDLDGIAKSLKATVDSINPLSLEQAIGQLQGGGLNSANNAAALSAISNINSSGFTNVLDFNRAKAAGVAAVNGMINNAGAEALGLKDNLSFLDEQRLNAMAGQADALRSLGGVASFDVGGKTKGTGLALLHPDEQVLTRGETSAMERNLEEMRKAIELLTVANNKMNRRFDKWDGEGLPATRVA